MKREEIHNGFDNEEFGDVDHENGDLLNFPIYTVTNVFASVCVHGVDNVDVNTSKEKEEVQDECDECDMDDYWDITVEEVERLRKILTPTIQAEPNPKTVRQSYMPLTYPNQLKDVWKEEASKDQ